MLQPSSPAENLFKLERSSAAKTSALLQDPQQWRVVVLSSLGHALCHMSELAITGALIAIQRQFELDQRIVTALPYLGYVLLGLGAIPAGLAVDRWGADRLLRWYYFGLALTAATVALAYDVATLFLGLTFLGVVLSIYHPVGIALISLGIPRREWAMGINGVAGSIGVALGPLLGGLWASLGYWQGAFWTLAVLALLAGWSMLRLRWNPKAASLQLQAESPTPSPTEARSVDWIVFTPLYLAMMLGGLNYRTLVTALPLYLTGDVTLAPAFAKGGLFSFAALLAGAIGQYGSGWLAQHRGPMRIYMGAILLMALFAASLALIPEPTLGLPIAIVLAICLFAQQPVENSLLAEGTSVHRRGLSYGMKFALTFGIGAFGAPIVGFIWYYTNQPRASFWFLTASGLTMAVALGVYRLLRRSYDMKSRVPPN